MPYDTRELLFDTISLNRQIGPFDSLSVNIFVPYHGTPLREWAIKEDWLNPNRRATSVISKSILEMPDPYISAPDILAMQLVFPLYVSMDGSEYPDIKRAEIFSETGNALFETLSEEFYRTKYGESEADRKLTFSG